MNDAPAFLDSAILDRATPTQLAATAERLLHDGDSAGALDAARLGERLALARSEPLIAARCGLHQATALATLGDRRAIDVARAAARAFTAAACAAGAARAHATVARLLAASGADGVVEELACAAVALDAVDAPSPDVAEAYAELAAAERAAGLVARAEDHVRRALTIADAAGIDEASHLRALAVHGEVVRERVAEARRAGDDATARALAAEWLRGWPRLEARTRRVAGSWPRLAVIAAALVVELGDELARALALLDDVRRHGDARPEIVFGAMVELARVNLATGHLTAAHALLDAAEPAALASGEPGALARVVETRAALCERSGDAAGALAAFKRYHQLSVADAEHSRRRQSDAVKARVAELVHQTRASALAEMAHTDPLTGLRNRRFLDGEAPALVEARRANGEPVCVAVIDVDNFKQVNDGSGHAAGDAVLVEVGRLLRVGVRTGDVVVRTGGDEFVLLLFGASLPFAHRALERLRIAVEQATWAAQGLPAVTLTIGAADVAHHHELVDAIDDADRELLSAKRAGRNVVHSAATRAPRATAG